MPTTTQLLADIAAGRYDAAFTKLYCSEDAVPVQRVRYTEAVQSFERIYGTGREVQLYSTPGRTEIGGNHTDHNNGLVLAAGVNLDIIAVVARNEGYAVHVTSKGFSRPDSVDVADLSPVKQEEGTSAAMIRGVAADIVARGGRVGGFDAYTTSDVLRGSGLSSSAAFEVCMAHVFNCEYNDGRFSMVELGMISQMAENKYFGKPSGLMDQTACAVGSAITIDFEVPGSPIVQEIPFDLSKFGFKMVITDTKGSHADLTPDYAAIRSEMEEVAALFGKKVLRDVPREKFYAAIGNIRQQTGDRAVLRSMHFYEECRRVGELAAAIRDGAFARFLDLIVEGGHSSFEYNQNAYSIRKPKEQGVALGVALSQHVLNGQGAWRLQGGGFAGTIQAFVPEGLLEKYCTTLRAVFGQDACYVLSVRGVGATQVLPK